MTRTKTEQMRIDGTLPEGTRCIANRTDGEPCRAHAIRGGSTCLAHGGSAPQVRKKAQERIVFAADKAAKQLIEFMQSSKVPYGVRLAACRDLLDRAGLNVGTDIRVELRKFEESIDGIYVDIVDGEVVGEDASPAALPPGAMEDEGDPLQQIDHSEIVQGREARSAPRSPAPSPTPMPGDPPPYGWRRERGELVPAPEEKRALQRMLELAGHQPPERIAQVLEQEGFHTRQRKRPWMGADVERILSRLSGDSSSTPTKRARRG
jgi:hypothetical protein